MSLPKGYIPWNKGKTFPKQRKIVVCLICKKKMSLIPCSKQKYCSSKCYGKTMVGRKVLWVHPNNNGQWNKGRKFPKRCGEGNIAWKGEEAKYAAIHMWIKRVTGKPIKCVHCGATGRKLHWANIDHKYSRNPRDYISLCVPCHRRYDYHTLNG
jgi:hypothetical protein